MGNKNALKHGAYTRVAIERRAAISKLIKEANKLAAELSKPRR